MRMKGLIINSAFCLLASLLIGFAANKVAAEETIPNPKQNALVEMEERVFVPGDTEFFDAEGKKVTLETFKGKVILLNFWATWCPSCVHELPDLLALEKKYADKGLVFVAVSEDFKGKSVVEPFLKAKKIPLQTYYDPKGKLYNTFKLRGLPQTIIIDRKQQVVSKIAGEINWKGEEGAKLLESLIEEKP
jgi:thiol-disulfide isomerase/thioredoxin